jgi:adenosylcobalamin-dependent ribonucleoside-triphosphate reductase
MYEYLSFRLPDNFVEKYAQLQPNWGYAVSADLNLSELIYVDKYSALKDDGTKEQWHETVRRCVEGYYSILKDHCKRNKTPWNDFKALASAKDAYDRMWNFKWLPPGRGLQHMGRPIVHVEGHSSALQNPLHENTNILTREGWKRLGDLEGSTVEVLTSAHLYARESSDKKNFTPKWTKAEISMIEYQPSVKIEYRTTLGEVKSIVASRNHRWFTKNAHHHNWKRVTSEELKVEGFLPTVRPHKNYLPSLVGMQHGFFFGDGSRTTGELEQFGASVAVLSHLFGHHVQYRDRCGWVGQLPMEWGKLPSGGYAEDQRYIYGFLAGYFAADGCVTTSGHMSISSARESELREVQNLFLDLGIEVSEPKLTSTSSNYAEERELWTMRINRFDLTEDFFLLQHHRERWLATTYGKSRTKKYARIISVEDAGVQPVLCATVPEYEQFVTQDFILTSNCSFISTSKLSNHSVEEATMPFTLMMEQSMWGIGVGYDLKGEGNLTLHEPNPEKKELFMVPDHREGWAESVGKLLESYFFKNRPVVEFDYSEVRPAGTPLKRFGGRASGPGPLITLHETLRSQLSGRGGETITSRDILDIMNKIGKAVVAGGARRSAQICFGDPTDTDYINAKNWNLDVNAERTDPETGWAWNSNNSVFVQEGDDYSPMVEGIVTNGEPGFMWLDLARSHGRLVDPQNDKDWRVAGGNPCLEQSLEHLELCTLVETFPTKHEDFADFRESLKHSYLYGKAVTLLPTKWDTCNEVMARNRRIGSSISGLAEFVETLGWAELRRWSDEGYLFIQHRDKKYSEWLAVRESIKTTSIKPSGTVSIVAGVTPGVHWPVASGHYIRRVRFSVNNPIVESLRNAGYDVEPAQGDPENTVVVSFLTKGPDIRNEREVTIWEKAELAVLMQRYWADNQVSATITFLPEEVDQLLPLLASKDGQFKGVSFLPLGDEAAYAQSPYEKLGDEWTEEKIQKHLKAYKPIGNIYEVGIEAGGDKFCDTDQCSII